MTGCVYLHVKARHISTKQTTELAKRVRLAHTDPQTQPVHRARQRSAQQAHTEHNAIQERHQTQSVRRVRTPQMALSHGQKDVILHATWGTSTLITSAHPVPFVLQAREPPYSATPQQTQYAQNAETHQCRGCLTGPVNAPSCAGTGYTTVLH